MWEVRRHTVQEILKSTAHSYLTSCDQIAVCCKTHYFYPHINCDVCLYKACPSVFGRTTMYLFYRMWCLPYSLFFIFCHPFSVIQLLLKQMQSKCHCRKRSCLKMHQETTTEASLILSRRCCTVVQKQIF